MPKRSSLITVKAGTYCTYSGQFCEPRYEDIESENNELVWSSGHYGYPDFNSPNVGGSFKVVYDTVVREPANVGKIQGGTVYAEHTYEGNVYPTGVTAPIAVNNDGSSFGATAYAKMKPDKPSMQGLNSIYELKDVPGMLRQRFLKDGLAGIGNYYLALKFGWEALLRDVQSLVITQQQAQDRLKQLIRDEGRPIKRRITLSDSISAMSQGEGTGNGFGPSFVTYFYADGGSWREVRKTTEQIWASARFRYWLPPGPRDVRWTTTMMAKIFGLNPTPLVVYNAIPWSWLIDWFTNAGDVVSNLQTSLVDRLAADYFYVMRHTENSSETTFSSKFYRYKTLAIVPVTATVYRKKGCKSRLPGDPFGFGTPANSLSGVQLSILGALGLSRLR